MISLQMTPCSSDLWYLIVLHPERSWFSYNSWSYICATTTLPPKNLLCNSFFAFLADADCLNSTKIFTIMGASSSSLCFSWYIITLSTSPYFPHSSSISFLYHSVFFYYFVHSLKMHAIWCWVVVLFMCVFSMIFDKIKHHF